MGYTEGFEPDYWDILTRYGIDVSLMRNGREFIIDGGHIPPVNQSEKDLEILKRFIQMKYVSSVSVVDEETKTVLTIKKIGHECITKSENYANFMKNHPGYIKRFNAYNT